MADANKDRFVQRLNTIDGKADPNKRLEKRVMEDGLVVHVAKTKTTRLIPYKSVLTGVFLFVLLKGFVLAELGQDIYDDRIEKLKTGNAFEVWLAFALDVDPASQTVAKLLESFR